MLGDTLSDAHYKRDLSLKSLLDTGGSDRGAMLQLEIISGSQAQRHIRDEESGSSGSSLSDTLRYVLEDGKVEMGLASLLGVCSTNNLGAYVHAMSFCFNMSIASRRDIFVPYSIACWAWNLSRGQPSNQPAAKTQVEGYWSVYLRSLPASETLEEHLGVGIDAEVLDGLGVRRVG